MEPINEIIKNDSAEYRRLTPERVRQEKGLEHLSDEQVEKIIRTLEFISIMHVDFFLKELKLKKAKKENKYKKIIYHHI